MRTEHDKTLLRRQIAATDAEIDRLVYDLYAQTAAEIGIVEGRPDFGVRRLDAAFICGGLTPRYYGLLFLRCASR